jgi:hypothetical protein
MNDATMARPLSMSMEMVLATLRPAAARPKTQARCLVELPAVRGDHWEPTTVGGSTARSDAQSADGTPARPAIWHPGSGQCLVCPHGVVGDLLWVREPWRAPAMFERHSPAGMAALVAELDAPCPIHYEADGQRAHWDAPQPGQESVQQPGRLRQARHMPQWASRILLRITDVRVERLHDMTYADAIHEGWDNQGELSLIDWYIQHWQGCGWESNPFVWVLGFERV